jgi:hypothetical protein
MKKRSSKQVEGKIIYKWTCPISGETGEETRHASFQVPIGDPRKEIVERTSKVVSQLSPKCREISNLIFKGGEGILRGRQVLLLIDVDWNECSSPTGECTSTHLLYYDLLNIPVEFDGENIMERIKPYITMERSVRGDGYGDLHFYKVTDMAVVDSDDVSRLVGERQLISRS